MTANKIEKKYKPINELAYPTHRMVYAPTGKGTLNGNISTPIANGLSKIST